MLHDVNSPPHGTVVECVWFDLNGSFNFSNVIKGNTCYVSQQGHFSIVVKSNAPLSPKGEGEKSKSNKVWIIIVGSVVGGITMVVVLSFLVLWMRKFKQKKKMKQMGNAADVGEPLHMTSVGDTKTHAATVTRTQPILEPIHAN
ncbi:hypothetical protein Lal_00000743 [Lupinus albus]|uniref:Uncharacterized protein n=1 Tax=Lupinus albus TaxID=3870 RepID=A0A6A4NHY9_LUPAL|nr:hypothetical protein Lalb_Chr24g0400431 [Lupinus albus]KAF1858923.1 hypothetical protein Lal_00000743 [Lupinus albus]